MPILIHHSYLCICVCMWFTHMFTWVCDYEYSYILFCFILFLVWGWLINEFLGLHIYSHSAPQICTWIKHSILQLLYFHMDAGEHVLIFSWQVLYTETLSMGHLMSYFIQILLIFLMLFSCSMVSFSRFFFSARNQTLALIFLGKKSSTKKHL